MPPRRRRGVHAVPEELTPQVQALLELGLFCCLWEGWLAPEARERPWNPAGIPVPSFGGAPWSTHAGVRSVWKAHGRELLARWRAGRYVEDCTGHAPFAIHAFERGIGETDLDACRRLGIAAVSRWYAPPADARGPVSPCPWHGRTDCAVARTLRLPRGADVLAARAEHEAEWLARHSTSRHAGEKSKEEREPEPPKIFGRKR